MVKIPGLGPGDGGSNPPYPIFKMKIGIISDTHDRIEKLQKVLGMLKDNNVKVLIHCGDFCAPFMMNELSKFNGEVHCVFGNVDDRFITPNRAKKVGINFHGELS